MTEPLQNEWAMALTAAIDFHPDLERGLSGAARELEQLDARVLELEGAIHRLSAKGDDLVGYVHRDTEADRLVSDPAIYKWHREKGDAFNSLFRGPEATVSLQAENARLREALQIVCDKFELGDGLSSGGQAGGLVDLTGSDMDKICGALARTALEADQ